jgi:hypothetical protein
MIFASLPQDAAPFDHPNRNEECEPAGGRAEQAKPPLWMQANHRRAWNSPSAPKP